MVREFSSLFLFMDIERKLKNLGYVISQGYGKTNFAVNSGIYRNDFHNGLDFYGGYHCKSLTDGKVTEVHDRDDNPYGKYVTVRTHGHFLQYCHLARIQEDIIRGADVRSGQALGVIGETGITKGAHVHLMVFDGDGDNVNPTKIEVKKESMDNQRGDNQPTLTYEQIVAEAYRGVLGREPDKKGLEMYTEQTESGESSIAEVMDVLVQSPEFRRKRLNANITENRNAQS